MAAGSPADVAQRWATQLGAASAKIKAGVMAVTQPPQQKAAAAVNTWLARINDPATAQKFVNNLSRQSLADWQTPTLQKGLARIAGGAQAAQPKFQAFMTSFLPFVQSVAAQVRSMPNATLEDRINRAVAQIRGTAAYRSQGH